MDDKYYIPLLRCLSKDSGLPSKYITRQVYGDDVGRSMMASVTQRMKHLLEVGWVKPLDGEKPIAYVLTEAGEAFLNNATPASEAEQQKGGAE